MKYKYLSGLVFIMVLTLSGCSKKQEIIELEQSLLKGEPYLLEIWTAEDEAFLTALGQEFVGTIGEDGLAVEVVGFSSEEVLQDAVINALAENRGPDLIYTNAPWIIKNKGKIHPHQDTALLSVESFTDQFLPAGHELVEESVIWGIPVGIETLGILYNEDLFIKNLKNQIKPQSTWEGFVEDVKNLKKESSSFERFSLAGVALGLPDNTHHGLWVLKNLFKQYGVTLFSGNQNEAVFATFNVLDENGNRENQSQNALQFVSSFADSRNQNFTWTSEFASSTNEDKEWIPFLEGRVAMIFGTARDFKKLQEKTEEESFPVTAEMMRTAALPQIDSKNPKAVSKAWTLGILKDSQNHELSRRFTLFAINPENIRSYFRSTGIPGSRRSGYLEQTADIDTGDLLKSILYAETPVYDVSLDKALENAWNQFSERRLSISKAVQLAQDEVNQELEEKIVQEGKIDIVQQKKRLLQ